jgi:toxin ParE1/3/4
MTRNERRAFASKLALAVRFAAQWDAWDRIEDAHQPRSTTSGKIGHHRRRSKALRASHCSRACGVSRKCTLPPASSAIGRPLSFFAPRGTTYPTSICGRGIAIYCGRRLVCSYEIPLTGNSARDLEQFHDYVAKHEFPTNADHVLDRIEEVVESLSAFFERGSHPRELLALGIREHRQTFFKPHQVTYRVMEHRAYTYLIADGRRDMQTLLASGEYPGHVQYAYHDCLDRLATVTVVMVGACSCPQGEACAFGACLANFCQTV